MTIIEMNASNENLQVGTVMQDLPSELLYEVFKRVDDGELDNVRNVCCRWNSIIDQWIGLPVSISTRRAIHPSNPDVSKVGLELIPEMGVKSLDLESYDRELLENPPSPLPSFKFPYLLRHLGLRIAIHPDLFRELVNGTVNLAKLLLSSTALVHLRKSDLTHLQLPKLKELEICTWADSELESLPNIQTLLKESHFPQLTALIIQFLVTNPQDLKTVKYLAQFLQAHCQLQKLSVTTNFPQEYNQDEPVNYRDELATIIGGIRERECCQCLNELMVKGVGVSPEGSGGWPQAKVCKELLLKSRSLRVLDLKIGSSIPNSLLEAICSRNGSTLEHVTIDYGTPYFPADVELLESPTPDCRAFSSMESVRSIAMIRPNGVTGTRHLPSSLVDLFFIHPQRILSDELDNILTRLPNLQNVHIWELALAGPKPEGYGVRVDTLKKVIQNRSLRTLMLYNSMATADEFPQAGLNNGNPVNPIMLQGGNELYWESYSTGFYKMAH